MKFTGKRILQKVVALLLVMIMTFADFSIIGANVISYALDMAKTNSGNVEFFAYFINEKEEKISNLESTINAEDLKLYVEVAVKNEGYFNGEITLGDSSFNFVENTSSDYVKQIKDNTVTLNQINAGITAKIELKVEFNDLKEINKTSLNQENEINLTGTYTSSKKDVEIEGTTKVQVNWKSPKDAEAKLDTKILTNSIYKVNDVKKRIVQVLIDSKLSNNSYPVKETNIELNIPNGAEEVKVHSRSTYATNGEQGKYEYNYDLNADNSKLTITSKNEEENGKINWNKNAKDTFVVTYVYPESTSFNYEKVNSNVTITTYDDKQVKDESQALISENIEGIVTNEIIEKENELYKGKIYTGEKRNYTSTTKLNIDYYGDVQKIQLLEEEAKFKTQSAEKNANIQFVKTKINKAEFIKLFGEDGYIKILDLKNNVLQTINNSSVTDNDGNIVVEYGENEKVIVIQTSKPISNGVLDIVHTKSILDNDLSRNEIRELVELKEQVNSSVTKNDGNNFKNEVTNTIKLKETSSDANITISKEKLSTITANQDVEIVATLETNGENKDLYKNPTVKVVFPKEIEEVHVTQAKALFRNGLDVSKVSQEKDSNGNIVLTVKFEGEQTKYDSDILNGLELHFFANIVVDKSIPSKDVTLKMEYTNENGIKDSYEVETKIHLESQYGLMLYNKIENFNAKSEIIETIDENKQEARLNVNKEDVTAKVTTSLINNYSKDLGRTEIIGRIPSKDDENSFDSTITGLNVNDSSAKIYYNKNVDAKANDNYWTKDSKDAKAYKIVLDNIKSGKVVKVEYSLNVQDSLSYNVAGDLTTDVSYTYGESNITKSSNIVLLTEEVIEEPTDGDKVQTQSGFEVNVSAIVGNKQLDNNDSIYDGEIIRYVVSIKNNTGKDYKDLVLKATQTNGKIFDLVETEVYNPVIYDGDGKGIENYWKVTDSNVKEFKNINIKNGKTITLEYQVVADKSQGDETYSDIFITASENVQDKLTTDKYKIKDAELKLTFVPALSEESYWTSESVQQANLDITNTTDEAIRNVEVKITLSKGLSCEKYEDYIDWDSDLQVEVKNKEVNSLGQTVITLKIAKINSGKTAEIYVKPYILNFNGETTNVEFYAKATTTLNNTYSSNNIIREVTQVRKQIEVEQIAKINGKAVSKNSVVNNGDIVDFYITIKNEDKESAKLNISDYIQKGLNVKSITLINTNKTEIDAISNYNDQNFIYDLELASGKEISIIISTIVDTTYMNGQNKIVNKVTVTDEESTAIYTSNVELDVNVEKIDDGKLNIEISQQSNVSDKIVKSGDKVEFAAKVKNIGDFDRVISIYDYINTAIKDITVLIDNDDVTDRYLNSNDLEIEEYTLKANDTITIKITGIVDLSNYTEASISNEFIVKSSIADIKSNTIICYTSQESKDENIDSKEPSGVQDYTVSGKAWIDSNKDGKQDSNEELLKDMVVKAINTRTKEVLTTYATTKEDGSYELTLPKAEYIIIFMYDNDNYYITTYQAKNVSEEINSDAVSKTLSIDGKDATVGTTDVIDLSQNKANIDIGLIFRNKFDLQLEKYVSKIIVTNDEGTKTYNFDNEELAKVEIASKYLSGSTVLVEYKIKVTNTGDIDGYVKNIVDYMPTDMTFSSDLNKNWYQSEKDLYNEELADKKLAPGESSEVTLVLTKTMTESNTGLVNNTAAIKSSYNEKSFFDANTDNDTGTADIIISVKTGAAIRLVLLTLSLTIVIAGIAYFVTKRYISRRI